MEIQDRIQQSQQVERDGGKESILALIQSFFHYFSQCSRLLFQVSQWYLTMKTSNSYAYDFISRCIKDMNSKYHLPTTFNSVYWNFSSWNLKTNISPCQVSQPGGCPPIHTTANICCEKVTLCSPFSFVSVQSIKTLYRKRNKKEEIFLQITLSINILLHLLPILYF